ncbi:hypothetical protein AQUCO_01400115v1 [Aquilegia coerulea]|uniref:Pentacotripeptide-repeat region of PRORP domain-containing protein n=1 Tax=Aquilegia coerulea TaxID=218851 RepID=A0A2G5DUN8_AQUCA|nr:hypothetical protein AQUCO_01400115v1 [Aquilegia coerulea]
MFSNIYRTHKSLIKFRKFPTFSLKIHTCSSTIEFSEDKKVSRNFNKYANFTPVLFFSSSVSSQNPNLDPNFVSSNEEEEEIQKDGYEGLNNPFDQTSSTPHFSDSESESQSESELENNDYSEVLDLFDVKNSKGDSFKEVKVEIRQPLVKEVCRLIQLRPSWNPKLERELRQLLRTLKPPEVCAVLRSQADVRIALSFFYWADRQWRYRHTHEVHYAMLEVLSKTKLCKDSKRVLRLMARRGIERRPEAYGYVMNSYSRGGKLRSAMRVLNMMQKAGCGPDLSICNTAIHVLVMANRLEKALRFLDRMQRVGIAPNVVSYNCLIKGYCDVYRVEDALQLIDEMCCMEPQCHPDKISYYTVMGFLCKGKRIKEVKQVLEKMGKDANLLPDQVTYNHFIHMLSKHGHADEALEFLHESQEKGFRIDKVGYSAVVHSFCQQGNLDKAKEIVNEMFSKGCIPDVVTYTAVVNGYCRIGKVDQAKKMLQNMYKHGCRPNTVSYTALLNGLCRIGNSSEAREMMMSEEDWWTPNAITYSVLMHGFRREGKLAEACRLVQEMVKKGFFPTPAEINLLIQSICRDKKASDAKIFLEDCLSNGCPVNAINFTTVIHGFCREGDLEAALSLLDDMYLSNRHPDVVTYTTMIDALAKRGRLEEATGLLNKMLHKGLVPTPVTYRTVIHRYCEKGKVDVLMKLLEKMLARQEFTTTYNQVIEKLCSFGNLDEAYKLLGKVLRTASRNDANTCIVLMESYLNKDEPLSAYKVACRMFDRNLIPDLSLCKKVGKRLRLKGKTKEAEKLLIRFVERGLLSPQLEND